MFETALIIFREIVEIALILSVVMAATRGIAGRGKWLWAGIGGGIVGAAIIAACTESIAAAFEDQGQELLNALILLSAAAMIGWTVIWMKTHGRQLSQHMRSLGDKVRSGETHMRVLSTVIALAVFREGAEIVLFSYGLIASGASTASLLGGLGLGIAGGSVVGYLMYIGLIKMATRHIFTVSAWLLALVAAGLAAKGVGFLVAIDMLPEWGSAVWDSSAILPQNTLVGQILSVLIGYEDQPSGMQLAAYGVVLAFISTALVLSNRTAKPKTIAP